MNGQVSPSAETVAAAPGAGGAQGTQQGRATILVVDDDPQTLRNVREALSKVGYVTVGGAIFPVGEWRRGNRKIEKGGGGFLSPRPPF